MSMYGRGFNINKRSFLEIKAMNRILQSNLPKPVSEFKFHPSRKWRFDLAWPDRKLAVELEGAVFAMGRHTRGSGFIKDCEKYNAAVLLGWKVLRYTSNTLDQMVADLKNELK